MNWVETGRFLMIAGGVLLVLGVIFMMADKLPIGHLPGDFSFGGKRVRIYIPLMTCVLLSIALTLIVNFFSKK